MLTLAFELTNYGYFHHQIGIQIIAQSLNFSRFSYLIFFFYKN